MRPLRALLLLPLALIACGGAVPPLNATPAAPPAAEAPRAAVQSVVVLELKESCACTQKRQVDSRAAFDATLAARATKPPLTVIQMDVEPEQAQLYKDMSEPVVAPAYYFLDSAGQLVTFLQGELAAEDFTAALGAP
ncbi:MAG: hypothetical protein ABIO70_00845 [Pseudomonadota bacterium]